MDILELLTERSELSVNRIKEFELMLNSKPLNDNIKTITIPPVMAYKYKYDFYGLLKQYFNLPPETHYFFLRINNLTHPVEYNGTREIKILDPETFGEIVNFLEQKESIE